MLIDYHQYAVKQADIARLLDCEHFLFRIVERARSASERKSSECGISFSISAHSRFALALLSKRGPVCSLRVRDSCHHLPVKRKFEQVQIRARESMRAH